MARTALVTGGTGGLGGAVTVALLEAGWRVVLPARRVVDPAAYPGHGGRAGGELVPVVADLTDEAAVAHAVELAVAQTDRPLGAVVNLVGGFAAGGRVHETPVGEFEAQLRLNLRPLYLVCHASLGHLVAAGGGAVVCVSSRSTQRPFPGAAGYLTAKAGVLEFADVLHAEYARAGVRVNTLLPAVIDTAQNRASQPDADRSGWVAPEVVARTITFLCSDDSAAIRGAHIPV
jgi:NAD(P)-dependent dehydrogenase (short-subunit alcohol dehydrogenase family)